MFIIPDTIESRMPELRFENPPGDPGDLPTGESNPDVVRYMKWRESRRPKLTYTYRRGVTLSPEEKRQIA